MAQGRCAGCHKIDASSKKMDNHIVSCPDFIALYKSDPAKALNPREEFARWTLEENNPEARADARDARLSVRFRELDMQREAQMRRWSPPPDILA